MACFILPGKNLIVLFVLLYVVLLFFSHVSSVLTSVTRSQRDTFSYSGIWDGCSKFCIEKNAFFDRDMPNHGICTCQCSSDRRTFIIAGLKCMADRDIRNTSEWNRGQTFHMCQVFFFHFSNRGDLKISMLIKRAFLHEAIFAANLRRKVVVEKLLSWLTPLGLLCMSLMTIFILFLLFLLTA